MEDNTQQVEKDAVFVEQGDIQDKTGFWICLLYLSSFFDWQALHYQCF